MGVKSYRLLYYSYHIFYKNILQRLEQLCKYTCNINCKMFVVLCCMIILLGVLSFAA